MDNVGHDHPLTQQSTISAVGMTDMALRLSALIDVVFAIRDQCLDWMASSRCCLGILVANVGHDQPWMQQSACAAVGRAARG